MKSFKDTTPLEKRIDESQQIINKYPDRIPVIVEKYFKCELPDVDKYGPHPTSPKTKKTPHRSHDSCCLLPGSRSIF